MGKVKMPHQRAVMKKAIWLDTVTEIGRISCSARRMIAMLMIKGIVLPIYPIANPRADTLFIRSLSVTSTRNAS
ncbi:hypothetical protein D3C86_2178860 [compost metagenome]